MLPLNGACDPERTHGAAIVIISKSLRNFDKVMGHALTRRRRV
jgi:hypothetical protein